MVDCRVFLSEYFLEKRRKNPSYSLRAFGASLGVSHGALSQILSGKRPLTAKTAGQIVERLHLEPRVKAEFLLSSRRSYLGLSPHSKTSESFRGGTSEFQFLEAETFQAIANWHFYALLSYFELPDKPQDISHLASVFGLSRKKIESALQCLEKLGLTEERDGRLWPSKNRLTSGTDVLFPALRAFTLQMLSKAEESLEKDPIDQRDFSTITMAIDPTKIPEAKEEIKRFRRRMSEFLETGTRERVYTLSIQLFPLDRE